ncbi:cardiolipin synthase [Prosthecobacter sp.]|uniref:cardiolipin synthase n=1 Tax=Prosthecobacter sp. TaxID=1965333 RepID=UPI002ABC72D2|nr:cardiolipin synthase [Prosthecobacter sp.]MDZ4404899.1 cardiolipin synthase [Prosthecobacter sp.]
MLGFEFTYWTATLAVVSIIGAVLALVHLLLQHRDYRSAAFWTALIVLSPLIGPLLYLFLGINSLRRRGRHYRRSTHEPWRDPVPEHPLPFVADSSCAAQEHQQLARTLDRISRFCFTKGNRVVPLCNGDEAMRRMLAAIRGAQHSISLASYIFEAIGIGAEFVTELSDAVKRGVQVRVMVDDAGTRYSWPPVIEALKKAGVNARRFMPNRMILRLITMNLRNHRKIMVVDGRTAFTGGMNIREGNMISRKPAHPVHDLHFEVTGPCVAQIQRVFAEDWTFCTGEALEGPLWFPDLTGTGQTSVIGIVDGPDEDMEVMPAAFFAALNAAREEVKIITPYFLPTAVLAASLRLCAIRGVKVTILTPAQNNIPFVAWAAQTLYPDLLAVGCRIFESPPPFDHSKFFLIDGVWSFLGSTNWDPRSLRLNFEFNIGCHDAELGHRLAAVMDAKLASSREITCELLEAAPVRQRLRNGFARLFIPAL